MQRKVAKVQLLSSFYTLKVLVRKFQADGYLLIYFYHWAIHSSKPTSTLPARKGFNKKNRS
jgi:hypothetical protein